MRSSPKNRTYRPDSQSAFPEVKYKNVAAGKAAVSNAAPGGMIPVARFVSVSTPPGFTEKARMLGYSVDGED